uniref:Multifunctional fusion protein n=1 Tax=Boldia erythrosiphon TaxID=74908 RepID=A0A1Y9TLY4_9RHOD|nr:translation elongation factor Ts [Boldia erythrosiphon]ARO90621.1 translation elongation factor Ts [Boldia erythrosiphon]
MVLSAQIVKQLREKTGAGMMDCKNALINSDGDMTQAAELLRQKGLIFADKKYNRSTHEGIVDSYIHVGRKVGVLIEVNCETDFVARRSEFQTLVKDLAMQIAANPEVQYVSKTDIPIHIIEYEKNIETGKNDFKTKSEVIKERIVLGRVEKRLKELCLMDQIFIKNQELTIETLVKEHISLLGENIRIRRFKRFILGNND